jgi:GGDEF domain-containing protein
MQLNEAIRMRLFAIGLAVTVALISLIITSLNPFNISIIYLVLLVGVISLGLVTQIWGGVTGSIVAVFTIVLISQYISVSPSEKLVLNMAIVMVAFLVVGLLAGWLSEAIDQSKRQTDVWLALAEQRAMHDKTLGALRPQWGKERLEEEVLRASQFFRPLSVAYLRMIPTKQNVSDRTERLVALQALARIVRSATNPPTALVHFGDDQLLLILPEHNAEQARQVVEVIRARTESERYFPKNNANLGGNGVLSYPLREWGRLEVGVSSFKDGNSADTLITQAREDLHV